METVSTLLKCIDECIAFITNHENIDTNIVKREQCNKKRISRTSLLLHGWLRDIAPDISTEPIFCAIYKFYPRPFKCIGIGNNSDGCMGLGHSDPLFQFETIPISNINPILNHINLYYNNIFISFMIHDKLTNKIYVAGSNYHGNCGINKLSAVHKPELLSYLFGSESSEPEKLEEILEFTECIVEDSTDIINVNAFGKLLLVTDKGQIYGAGDNYQYMFGQQTNEEHEYKVTYLPQVTNFFLSQNMKIKKITCGEAHTLFLLESHRIFSCGCNEWSQCGVINKNVEYETIEQPTLVENIPPVYDICCSLNGNLCLCVDSNSTIKNGFTLWVFGLNESGELGRITDKDPKININNSDLIEEWKAIAVPRINFDLKQFGIKKVSASTSISICIGINGKCWTMGRNEYGALGINEKEETNKFEAFYPQQLKISQDIDDACCDGFHSVLLTESNEIYTFGCNESKQCSLLSNENNMYKPYHLSRQEIGIHSKQFIENILCVGGSTILVLDK